MLFSILFALACGRQKTDMLCFQRETNSQSIKNHLLLFRHNLTTKAESFQPSPSSKNTVNKTHTNVDMLLPRHCSFCLPRWIKQRTGKSSLHSFSCRGLLNVLSRFSLTEKISNTKLNHCFEKMEFHRVNWAGVSVVFIKLKYA